MYACCNCGEELDLDSCLFCSECGGQCCDEECRNDHDCDPEGDIPEED